MTRHYRGATAPAGAPHQVAPGMYCSHGGFLQFLGECASRWAALPEGESTAEMIRRKREQYLEEATCDVCRTAQARSGP